MRVIFTAQEAYAKGISPDALRWGVGQGRWVRVAKGAYAEGPESPTRLECQLGALLAGGTMATGLLAGMLYGLDGVSTNREPIPVQRYWCADAPTTVLSLAPRLDDLRWEQALESALRKQLVTVDELEIALKQRRVGNARIRRVLAQRPDGAAPTESLLETYMVQLIRSDATLPTPTRQVVVRNRHGKFVARVDLAWPEHGVFLELDGSQHKDQPQYDATRQTSVISVTHWLIGRFTWDDVVHHRTTTLRRLRELFTTPVSV